FMDIGNCYRMGGDEFCVLIPNGSPTVCAERIKELKDKIDLCKPIGDGFRMGVACGFKMYDIRDDYNISDTIKRADMVMYEDKAAMKELAKEKTEHQSKD
ncbi:MAG: diguanylate cyclase, partial [Acetatifactor sp.]|nr:diguanylate cyclase [Acetatifactor sp.]